jgi:hypothetical protein
MRKRFLLACAVGTLAFAVGSVAAVSATVPPPVDTVVPGDAIPDEQGGLVGIPETTTLINPAATTTIPEGCFAQTIPQVVFVGKVENVSDASVSFSMGEWKCNTELMESFWIPVRYTSLVQ